jgi:hypothetical protein
MSLLVNPPFNDSDTALRACASLQSEATMQAVSAAKNNRVNLPGQCYSTQIPACLSFIGKNEPAGKYRTVADLEPALAA